MDPKWTAFEKSYNHTFDKNNPYCYLFSDAGFFKKIEDFKPERQWLVACGKLFKEDDLRRYFCSVETKKDFLLDIFVPTNTFYDQFYIYDHNYIENEPVELYWRDMMYVFSFDDFNIKKLETGRDYIATRGKIIKQTETHILLEVEKYLQFAKNHKAIQDKYKYMSIPKSYIRNFKKVGGEWQVALLKKVTPKLDPIITESKINFYRLRSECENFAKKHNFKRSFLEVRNKQTKWKPEYGITFSYFRLKLGYRYIGKLNIGIFNKIKKKYFITG